MAIRLCWLLKRPSTLRPGDFMLDTRVKERGGPHCNLCGLQCLSNLCGLYCFLVLVLVIYRLFFSFVIQILAMHLLYKRLPMMTCHVMCLYSNVTITK